MKKNDTLITVLVALAAGFGLYFWDNLHKQGGTNASPSTLTSPQITPIQSAFIPQSATPPQEVPVQPQPFIPQGASPQSAISVTPPPTATTELATQQAASPKPKAANWSCSDKNVENRVRRFLGNPAGYLGYYPSAADRREAEKMVDILRGADGRLSSSDEEKLHALIRDVDSRKTAAQAGVVGGSLINSLLH